MRFKRKSFDIHLILLVSSLICLIGCKSYYLEQDSPEWLNNNTGLDSASKDFLKVVSYNIQESKNIDIVIEEFKTIEALKYVDIILLQEMDLVGVVKLSENLNLNYIYYPIGHYKKEKRDVGNAILSKYKIESPKKLILPHKKFIDKGKRMSCSALIKLGKMSTRVHSIHLETIAMRRGKRFEQLNAILEDIKQEPDDIEHFIVGGDFNSMFKKDREGMAQIMQLDSFEWSTPNIGTTGSVPLDIFKPQLDHIYTRGFELVDYGLCEDCKASDHKPIWAILEL